MSKLVIVESPTKARTLSRFLGKEYQIEATYGHVRDLPKDKLGIEITPSNSESKTKSDLLQFIPDYQIIADRKSRISQLKKLALAAQSIILATDPDREGEAIAWHMEQLLKSNKSSKRRYESSASSAFSFHRIVFHEITNSAITMALDNPQQIDMKLVDAQQARRILDRLVGYKLSPLLWNKLGKRWLSAGRVQTVAVRLIVEREREIEAFVPQEYWLIDVELSKEEAKSPHFLARLHTIDEKKADIGNQKTAEQAVADLEKASYRVSDVEKKEVKRYAPPPFITSTLQQFASNRFGWSAKRTMRTAQNLYEEGYITYHRTDSTNLAAEALNMVRNYIGQVYGDKYLPSAAKYYKTKSKVAQEAHEAIRPTNIKVLASYDSKNISKDKIDGLKIKTLSESLGRDAQLLYSLIWKRFTACQMTEASFDHTTIITEANTTLSDRQPAKKYLLRTTGQKIKFDGWLVLYVDSQDVLDNGDDNDKAKYIPDVKIDDSLKFHDIIPQQKFTEPPPRYNEASLIKTLEEKGIGRPSTYAPIISTIQDRKYVEKIDRRFHPTDLGIAVVDFLVKYFTDLFDISFTAGMEDELDEIANSKYSISQVLSKFYVPLRAKLDMVFQKAERVKMDLGTTDEKCPKCKSSLSIRLSKYGKFLACSSYPKCKYTRNILEKIGIKCPRCSSEMVVKKTRRGKQFYGCSSYPKCTFAAWKKEEIK